MYRLNRSMRLKSVHSPLADILNIIRRSFKLSSYNPTMACKLWTQTTNVVVQVTQFIWQQAGRIRPTVPSSPASEESET